MRPLSPETLKTVLDSQQLQIARLQGLCRQTASANLGLTVENQRLKHRLATKRNPWYRRLRLKTAWLLKR